MEPPALPEYPAFSLSRLIRTVFDPTEGMRIVILIDLEDPADLGYPASVQDDDGTIITAYYCSGVSQHQRYHMGTVRWTLEA